MTKLGAVMDGILIGVRWRDSCGTYLVDATTLFRLANVLEEIKRERGRVTGIRWLEVIR